MFKKLIFVGAGGLLVLGLLFGRNLVPYASTAVSSAQDWADSQVDTEYKIKTARGLLEKVEDRIEPMVYDIARQKVEVERMAEQVLEADDALTRSHVHIMKLRDHLDSGDSVYVSTSGSNHSSEQVRLNLQRSFRNYKQKEQKLSALRATLQARQNGLTAAQKNLEATHAKRIDLATQIDNLEAQAQMLQVAETASKYNKFDNSELARTEDMIDQIKTRIDTRATVLAMAPQLTGDIPMDELEGESGDIMQQIDAYFGTTASDDVVKK